MICEHCKQRHASVTVTKVQNGQTVAKHYCEHCASKFHPFQTDIQEEPVALHQLISNWFGVPMWKSTQTEEKKATQNACPSCSVTYRQFLKQGKFGCAECYSTFREQLPPVFSRLQAGTSHTGKSVAISIEQLKQKIEEIRQHMQYAIEEERFEDAAKMRDEIKSIQHKLDAGGVDV
ncbi:UvrB/UvrC motif-containing protein [Metasolibacillus meyeri]|uniref:UvrB/UvrC motif-containing protein n=1 Tax=Metasolibacillus meyeri TaxID=1071052 RepID=UPI000D2FBBC5|nr:UvrB/UvrC motif-containing protein [Metasolibacillus meyeri]